MCADRVVLLKFFAHGVFHPSRTNIYGSCEEIYIKYKTKSTEKCLIRSIGTICSADTLSANILGKINRKFITYEYALETKLKMLHYPKENIYPKCWGGCAEVNPIALYLLLHNLLIIATKSQISLVLLERTDSLSLSLALFATQPELTITL